MGAREGTPGERVARVVVLAPMKPELRPFLRKLDLKREPFGSRAAYRGHIGDVEVIATLTHIGMDEARATTERAIDEYHPDHVIVSGVAGGLGSATEIGHLVMPDVVVDYHTGAEYTPSPLVAHPADRRGRIMCANDFIYDTTITDGFERQGVVAVDMETAAVAAVCTERNVRWSVYRGISDHVDDAKDDSVLKLVNPDGSANPVALVTYLARDPRRVKVLAALAKGSSTATNLAADAAIRAITSVSTQ